MQLYNVQTGAVGTAATFVQQPSSAAAASVEAAANPRTLALALRASAAAGDVATLVRALNRGADVLSTGPDGLTALQLACMHGHAVCVAELLKGAPEGGDSDSDEDINVVATGGVGGGSGVVDDAARQQEEKAQRRRAHADADLLGVPTAIPRAARADRARVRSIARPRALAQVWLARRPRRSARPSRSPRCRQPNSSQVDPLLSESASSRRHGRK